VERQSVRVWYDAEGDYLEVIFEQAEGCFRETENDQVMEKVSREGRVLGFSIQKISSLKERPPFAVALQMARHGDGAVSAGRSGSV
jgi:hypothetical protein